MSTRHYGAKVVEVILPRKVCNALNNKCLYPKPTQVGK